MKQKVNGLIVDLGLQYLVPVLRANHPLWRIESAYDLLCLGAKMQSDYSLIKFTEAQKLVLITNDRENVLSCEENDIPVIYQMPLRASAQHIWLARALEEKYDVYEPEMKAEIFQQ